MFNLIIVGFLTIVGTIFWLIAPDLSSELSGLQIFGIFFWSSSGLWLVISSINWLGEFDGQFKNFEELRAKIRKAKLLEKKSDHLIKEFKSYLGEKYPGIEKEIFENISGVHSKESMKLILVKYPEIKSSKVFKNLVEKIGELVDDIYEMKNKIVEDCVTIRYKTNSRWYLFMPKIPSDLISTIRGSF